MKKTLTLFSLLIIGILTANAQYYYLPFPTAGQNPGGLNTDTEYPVGGGQPAGWTSIHAGSAATAQWSSTNTIPFTFEFNGATVSDYKVSTSGVLTFTTGAATAPPVANTALPSASVPDNSVCVWGITGSGTNDNICHKTFGSAPNRQHWVIFSSYTDPGNGAYTYFAIVLEETTNNIYVVDQRNGGTALTLSIGIQINSTTAVSVAGSPNVAQLAGADATPIDNAYYQFIYGTQVANDAELSVLSYNQFVVAPASVNIGGTITNYGSQTITDITVSYESAGTTYTDNKTGLNIVSGTTYNFTHSTPLSVPTPGSYPVKVWVELTGDANQVNDTLNGLVGALAFLPTKRVVFEEATGTWCGWCPRGAVYMDSLAVLHPNTAMLIAVHNQDPMVVAAYDAGMGAQIGGYPSGLVDRKDNDVDPSTFIAEYNQRINDVAPCDVDVVATFNPANLMATINLSAHFAADATGDYRFNAVITEDDVTGTTSAWNQTNYYSYQSQNIPLQGAGHNWQAEPQVVPAANMEYDHVARALLGGWNGQAGSLPSNLSANSTYTYTFTFQLPATFDLNQLRAIGWVQDFSTGYILNSNFSQIVMGVDNIENQTFGISVYPNPVTADFAKVKLNVKKEANVNFQIIDVLGNVVRNNQSELKVGSYEYPLNLQNLANGVYTVRVTSGTDALTQKIILSK